MRATEGDTLLRVALVLAMDELVRLRRQLAEHERLQTLGGPPPPVDPNWANRSIEPPASASDPSAPRLRR